MARRDGADLGGVADQNGNDEIFPRARERAEQRILFLGDDDSGRHRRQISAGAEQPFDLRVMLHRQLRQIHIFDHLAGRWDSRCTMRPSWRRNRRRAPCRLRWPVRHRYARAMGPELVALARIDLRVFFVEGEVLAPARILVDPRILDARAAPPIRKVPQMLNRNARYSVVKLAMLCGPITRRGSVSPTSSSPRRSAARRPSGWTRATHGRSRSTASSSVRVHRLISPS